MEGADGVGEAMSLSRDKCPCPVCEDGMAPTRIVRVGRCSYFCRECGRDVSLAVILIADAIREGEG